MSLLVRAGNIPNQLTVGVVNTSRPLSDSEKHYLYQCMVSNGYTPDDFWEVRFHEDGRVHQYFKPEVKITTFEYDDLEEGHVVDISYAPIEEYEHLYDV